MIATSPASPTWRGTTVEHEALSRAVVRYCRSTLGADGDQCRAAGQHHPGHICAMHEMLQDQRALDHLLFARRIRLRLLAEELGAFEPLVQR